MIISRDSVEASLSKYPNGEPLCLARVMNVHKEVIPPCTVTRIDAHFDKSDAHFDKFEDRSEFDDLIVEALQLEYSDSIVVANTLVANNGRCFLIVINMTDHNVKLDPNQTLGVLSEVGEIVPSPLQPATFPGDPIIPGAEPQRYTNPQIRSLSNQKRPSGLDEIIVKMPLHLIEMFRKSIGEQPARTVVD